jgi:hypothetical protein
MIGRGHIIQLKAKAVAGRQLHDLKHLKGEGPMSTAVNNTAGRGRRQYWRGEATIELGGALAPGKK